MLTSVRYEHKHTRAGCQLGHSLIRVPLRLRYQATDDGAYDGAHDTSVFRRTLAARPRLDTTPAAEHHLRRFVLARSITSSPRPFNTAFAMYNAKPPT